MWGEWFQLLNCGDSLLFFMIVNDESLDDITLVFISFFPLYRLNSNQLIIKITRRLINNKKTHVITMKCGTHVHVHLI